MRSLSDPAHTSEIRSRLGAVRADSKARWGRMNAHQMCCHLADSFRLGTGERGVSMASTPLPRPVMRFFALYVPMPWPKGLPTMPEADQEKAGTRPVEFKRDRAELLAIIERFVAGPDTRARHPLFGSISAKDWLRWGYLHADHHLRQFGV